MNQILRQNSKTNVEKDFYKLINKSNFGYDCRNKADNCSITPIFDKTEFLSHAKKYQNTFDPNISNFVSSKILERQIKEDYLNKISALDQQDEYYKV